MWLVSSKTDKAAPLEEVIKQSKSDPRTKIIEASQYEVLAFKGIYSGVTFDVFLGSDNKDPFIIEPGTEIPKYIDQDKIEKVPIELYSRYKDDIQGSIRDISGKSTASTFKLFGSIEMLEKTFIVPNAFTNDVIILTETGQDALKDFMTDYLPKVIKNKMTPRYLHVDTALSGDRLGLSMCHSSGIKKVKRLDNISGQFSILEESIIKTDMAVGIQHTPGQQIPFFKIREFVIYLRNNLGYNIVLFSCDGFQSQDMMMLMRQQNFETDETSADKTKDPYIGFRLGISEERSYVPNNKILLREAKNVEDQGKKIDHPKKNPDGTDGSKDILDAVVCSQFNCRNLAKSNQLYNDEQTAEMDKYLNKNTLFNQRKNGINNIVDVFK
jgi:hypothetical protein